MDARLTRPPSGAVFEGWTRTDRTRAVGTRLHHRLRHWPSDDRGRLRSVRDPRPGWFRDPGNSRTPYSLRLLALRWYRSSSTGLPGSIFFFTPSRPAHSIAAKDRYGLQAGSGVRYSIRFAALMPW